MFSWLQTYLLEQLCYSGNDSHRAYRRWRRSPDTDHCRLLMYSRHRHRLPRYVYTHFSHGHHITYTVSKVGLIFVFVVWGINRHNRSTGVDTAVFWPSRWKCIRSGENCG